MVPAASFASHFVVKNGLPSSSPSHMARFLASKETFDSKSDSAAQASNPAAALNFTIQSNRPRRSVAPGGGMGPNLRLASLRQPQFQPATRHSPEFQNLSDEGAAAVTPKLTRRYPGTSDGMGTPAGEFRPPPPKKMWAGRTA